MNKFLDELKKHLFSEVSQICIMIIQYRHFDLVGKAVLEHVIFEPPLRGAENMQNEACYIYAVNGTSKAYSGQEQATVNTGESVLVKCGAFLNQWKVSSTRNPYEAIAFHLYPEVLRMVYDNQIPDFMSRPPVHRSHQIQKLPPDAVIKHYMDNLLFYFENPSLITPELIKLKIKELVLLLYNTDNKGIQMILSDLFNPEQVAFKEVIKANLFDDLSIEDFAFLTNMSLSSFKRKFKKVYNDSPARYIKNKRLEKAAELLTISNLRVTDVCYECGFNNLSNFSKSFFQKYNTLPSNFGKNSLN